MPTLKAFFNYTRVDEGEDEVIQLCRTELGRCLKMGFEVVGQVVSEGGMASLGVVISDVLADFEPGFGQAGEAAAVEQFGLEVAPKRFGVGVVVAVAAPVHVGHGAVTEE